MSAETIREKALALLAAENRFFRALPNGWLRRLVDEGHTADLAHVDLLNAQTELEHEIREIVL